VVSVGGGSVTDAAIAVRLCLANNVHEPSQLDGLAASCKPPVLRQVAVPTTLSAGEFSDIAGVTNEGTHAKELFRHPGLVPCAVVLDASIARHTPQWLFLSTGVRAIDHCVEGFCSPRTHAYAQGQCLHGLRLLASGLVRVKEDPTDLESRLACLQGAWLSMGAASTGVPMGASHGIGYVLGAAYGVPHGHTSCVMLPAVLRWNRPVTAQRQAQLAAALGAPGEEAADLVADLIARLGMPRSLAAVGIGPEQLPRIAQLALATSWVPHNPRPIERAQDVQEILSLAA
jgi:alcohol dehydrogenase class IV